MTLFVLAVGLIVGAALGITGTAMWFLLHWPQLDGGDDE